MRKTIYFFNEGKLIRKDNTIFFETKSGKKPVPVEDIGEICIIGEVATTKKFLEFCTTNKIILHYFNYYEYYVGSYYPREHYSSGYMILKQAEYYMDENKRKYLAYKFISGSALNILTVLKYYSNREKNVGHIVDNILELMYKLNLDMEIPQMMAIEGNIREEYYSAFDVILENDDFAFDVRTRRPPQNRMNSLISFGNSLLYTTVLGEVYNTHLDPRIGYLHSTNNRRFTLNLDVAEIFKPIIVDRVIFTLIGKKIINTKHFNKHLDSVLLNDEGRRLFSEQYVEKLKSVFMHNELGRHVSYKRLMRMELYKLEKHFMGDNLYEPFVSKW